MGVAIALEVEEAHADVQASKQHGKLTAGDARAQFESTSSDAIKSVLKLQRSTASSGQGMDSTRLLPSLWTSKPQGDRFSPADGFHKFEELRSTNRRAVQFPSGKPKT